MRAAASCISGAMARRSNLETLVVVAAKLPWWLSLILAAASYFFLHGGAPSGFSKPEGDAAAVMTDAVREGLLYTFASLGQYLLPFMFVFGAILSVFRSRKKAAMDQSGMQCPKCGGEMVLRAAKKGANAGSNFWGCSAYPKCRGTRNA